MVNTPNFLTKDYKNLLDYIYRYGNKTFSEKAFTDVDALVFSALSYIPFESFLSLVKPFKALTIKEACLKYFHYLTVDIFASYPDWMKKSLFLALALVETRRYSNCKICDFSEVFSTKREAQFAAFDILLNPSYDLVVYRGTDTSVTGWKEDFNLCYQPYIPSQKQALSFLKDAFTRHADQGLKYILAGHSKGGNLACYAASFVEESKQRQISKVYSFDGPGQIKEVFDSPGHKRIEERIVHIVPQDSVIGILLSHEKVSYVVEAFDKKDLISQHDYYTWLVKDDSFVKEKDRTPFSYMLENTFNDWLVNRLEPKEREELINAFFDIIEKLGITSSEEVFGDYPAFILKFIRRLNKENKKQKAVVKRALKSLVMSFKDSIPVYNKYLREQKQALKLVKRSA